MSETLILKLLDLGCSGLFTVIILVMILKRPHG